MSDCPHGLSRDQLDGITTSGVGRCRCCGRRFNARTARSDYCRPCRPRGAGQPVKPGAGQRAAGCFQAGQAGNGAPTLLDPPGEQVASQAGGSIPRTPSQPAESGSDQQRRVLTTGSSTPLGVSARTRRSTGRCGWTVMLAKTATPADGKAVWRKCQWRGCSHCGPELRERNLAHDLGNMAGYAMTRRLVARAVWPAVREKIKRAGGLRVVYPQPGGMLAVWATAGLVGEVVGDQAEALAGDYGRIPNGESIRRSREWALNPAGGKREGPAAWQQLGTSAVTDRVPVILRDLGLYRGEVDEGAVPLEAWEAHNFTVPPLHSRAFRQLELAFGLQAARPGKRRRGAAA